MLRGALRFKTRPVKDRQVALPSRPERGGVPQPLTSSGSR
jgi:hypothetical protein